MCFLCRHVSVAVGTVYSVGSVCMTLLALGCMLCCACTLIVVADVLHSIDCEAATSSH